MLIPIKCLTYSLIMNSSNFITWYNNNNNTFKEFDMKYNNDVLDFSIIYEANNMYHNKESINVIPIDSIKTSLFLNYKDDKYYERIEQKVMIDVKNNFNKKLLFGNKEAITSNRYLKKSNNFLTKNNHEIDYSEIEKELIKELDNLRF